MTTSINGADVTTTSMTTESDESVETLSVMTTQEAEESITLKNKSTGKGEHILSHQVECYSCQSIWVHALYHMY